MLDLDTEIGDIRSNISDRELEITQDLRVNCLENENMIMQMGNMMAKLDWYYKLISLLGFAEVAHLLNYTRPEMLEEGINI
jgi:DNA mismatch repair ATPase MutS